MDRAWVFILLARQQGIDAAVLALPDRSDALHHRVRPWVVGVLSEGNLYLFDPFLGVPIPGPKGVKRGESEPLDIQPATLEQVWADDLLLRRMDADSKHRYGVSSTDVKGGVIALVEASPAYLAQRMKLVESMLTGDNRVVLTASPGEEAERLKACRHVTEVRLWDQPYETVLQRSILGPRADELFRASMAPFSMPSLVDSRAIRTFTEEPEAPLFYADRSKDLLDKPDTVAKTRRRERSSAQRSEDAPQSPLFKARIKHLKGELTGESNAIALYQLARPSDADLDAAKFLTPQDKAMYRTGKQDAAYWLALLAFEQRKFDSARDSLVKRVLESIPSSVWVAGAKYNLARAEEADGKFAEAILQYRANAELPDGQGNLLRGAWLEAVTGIHGEKPAVLPAKPGETLPALPGLPVLPGLDDAPSKRPAAPQAKSPPAKVPPESSQEKPAPAKANLNAKPAASAPAPPAKKD
jgi:tetratricopeptide (TPR) repeat protein